MQFSFSSVADGPGDSLVGFIKTMEVGFQEEIKSAVNQLKDHAIGGLQEEMNSNLNELKDHAIDKVQEGICAAVKEAEVYVIGGLEEVQNESLLIFPLSLVYPS